MEKHYYYRRIVYLRSKMPIPPSLVRNPFDSQNRDPVKLVPTISAVALLRLDWCQNRSNQATRLLSWQQKGNCCPRQVGPAKCFPGFLSAVSKQQVSECPFLHIVKRRYIGDIRG